MRKGRFGPYAQHGKTVANLPRGVMMDDITLDEAVALLAEKGKVMAPKGKKGAASKKAAAKPAAKKAVEKPTAKKTAAKPKAAKAPAKAKTKKAVPAA